MASKFYLTTPLYYVNAPAHIGHSYTTIAADSIARFMRRSLGQDKVWLLTGTDEHGQKIQKAALEQKLSPQAFADKAVAHFKELWKTLNISYNDFIRTTEPRHERCVQRVLEILFQKGDIYQAKYEGWYCTPCETFWLESQLAEGTCPDCRRSVERISEDNYFLRLSKYQDWLVTHIETNPNFIQPQIRRNEVLSFLKLNKLTDLCVSRPKERLGWGIPLPFSAQHVTYVWFDALISYISAVGEFDDKGNYKSKWWPADLHLIGKDILRQHAVYWPIMLKALGIELPKAIFAHGWWMVGENKMSKSKGNVISPLETVKKYGIEAYRYFLLRDVPFGGDGTFSEEALVKRFNADLANDLGNLVFRTLTMDEKYFSGKIPEMGKLDKRAQEIIANIKAMPNEVKPFLSNEINFSLALERIWVAIAMANKYVEEAKPWNLSKEKKEEELASFIRLLVEVIRAVADNIEPFMPDTAAAIREQFAGGSVKKGKPLFPRIA
jgi:methionyl-tRNA synthetase